METEAGVLVRRQNDDLPCTVYRSWFLEGESRHQKNQGPQLSETCGVGWAGTIAALKCETCFSARSLIGGGKP